MSSLSISYLFDQFKFYQQHYLSIIKDPQQYYTPVEGAFIDVWPLKKKQLFLGDLLQLWFAEKWQLSLKPEFHFEIFLNDTIQPVPEQKVFVFALQGNLLTTKHQAQVWSAEKQQVQYIELDQLYRHVFEYKALSQPKAFHYLNMHNLHIFP